MAKRRFRQLLFAVVSGVMASGSLISGAVISGSLISGAVVSGAVISGIAGFSFVLSAHGQTGLLVSDYPRSYVVQEDDTLWNIASQFLRDPGRWPQIWQADDYLDNPNLLYPGDTLKLSLLAGSPRLLVQRGGRAVRRITPQIRAEPLQSVMPAIPLELIENSFTRNRIISQADYDAAPYIVANSGNNLILSTGDEVYARGTWSTGTTSFEIYRAGRTHFGKGKGKGEEAQSRTGQSRKAQNRKAQSSKPALGLLNTGEQQVLGLEVEYLGFASIIQIVNPDMRKLLINSSAKEIGVGDRLLTLEEPSINTAIFPTQPNEALAGQIVAFLGAGSMASQLDSAVIDLGLQEGLAVGNILSIQLTASHTTDPVERERAPDTFNTDALEIPGKEIGTLLVYKTFERLSYAVIVSSTQPVELYNEVVSP